MKPMRLVGLAVLAIALVALAVWFGREDEPQSHSPSQGLLWPQLEAAPAGVERVAFHGAGDLALETLERGDDGWRVLGHDGWWADSGRIDALLRELARARKLEAKTAISERHGLLGVEDIASAAATGIAMDITVSGSTRRLLVGNPNPHSSGRFVRFADEAQAWLVDAELDLPADPRQWLDRELLDVASRRVERLEITPAGDGPVVLVRTPGEAPGHALADVPGDREVDPLRVETAATLFEGLRLDDVKRAPDVVPDGRAGLVGIRLVSVDGLVLDAHSWREGDVRWMQMQLAFDEPVARAWVEAEIERDRLALEAARAPAVDGGEAAAAPLDPEAAGIGAMDAAQRVAALHADVATLRARLQGWAFSLSPRKQAIIEAASDDYLTTAD